MAIFADDIEQFSIELHESIEASITDMLVDTNFNGINPDDYNSQF